MKKSYLCVLAVVSIVMFVVMSCAPQPTATSTTATETAATTAATEVTETTAATTAAKAGPFNVGLSNGPITHSWRTQMLSDFIQQTEYYKGKGLIGQVFVQHAGTDVDTQIAQIRNIVSSGVDLLLINPNSTSALDPVIEEAADKGVMVIVFDQPVTSAKARLMIYADQNYWMGKLTEWVISKINGKGNLVYVSGIEGQPGNTLRDNAFNEVLKKYPDVKLLTKINGNWDPATAQQAMSDVLAAFPKIDAVVSQDGMVLGTIKAFEAANRPIPVINGEGMTPFIEYWINMKKEKGFESFAIANGPGFTINMALGIGLRLLQGKELKDGLLSGKNGNELLVKNEPEIDNNNVEQIYSEHLARWGNAQYIDGWYTEEKLDELFK